MDVDTASAGTAAAIRDASTAGTDVIIRWLDGDQSTLSSLWLRDNCTCSQCRHAGSGQRLLDTLSIAEDTRVGQVTVSGDRTMNVTWAPDGHASSYSAEWLRSTISPEATEASGLWNAAEMADVPQAAYNDVRYHKRHLRDWLAAADRYGFALLHGVPVRPGSIFSVVDLFGFVRETNYGSLFDVRSVINPSNLAYTGLALGPHTDNPYRDPTPTLQLLHCLSSNVTGGDTTLVDGFRVAEDLRVLRPDLFELLSRHPLQYRYRDEGADLQAEFPVISCDVRGTVTAIHFNSRSTLPFRLPAGVVEPYYQAYRTFARMLVDPTYQISLRLEPGDLVIMNNVRVLHGRTGFSAEGKRHLQGCYSDGDGLRSTLAVLSRSLDGSLEQKRAG